MNHFSDRENKIIKIIGSKKMTLREIAVKLFEKDIRSFDATITTGKSVIRIIKKCSYYDLTWTLMKTKKQGSRVLTITRVRR